MRGGKKYNKLGRARQTKRRTAKKLELEKNRQKDVQKEKIERKSAI